MGATPRKVWFSVGELNRGLIKKLVLRDGKCHFVETEGVDALGSWLCGLEFMFCIVLIYLGLFLCGVH